MQAKRGLAACLLLILASGLPGCQSLQQPRDAGSGGSSAEERDRFARALAYFSQGVLHESENEPTAAISNFQAAVALDPDHEELHFRLAMALLQERRFDEARELLETYTESHPKSEKAWLWLALVYRASDQESAALDVYARLRKLSPASPAGYVEAAGLLIKLNRAEEGIILLEEASTRIDDNVDILRVLGELFIRRAAAGDIDDGDRTHIERLIPLMEEASEKNPSKEALLYLLGDLYILDQRVEKAIACFEKIEALNPDDLRVKQKLAMSFVAMGNKEKAIETLERIAREQPSNSRVFFYLGELYEQLGDRDKSVLNFTLASKAGPNEPAAYLKLALMYADKSPDEAIKVLEEGLTALPHESRLAEMLAYIHMGQKNYEKALDAFGKAQSLLDDSKTEPMTPSFSLNHAISFKRAGKTAEAADKLLQTMKSNPAYLEAFMQQVMADQGDIELQRNLAVLDHLAAKTPEDPQLYIYMGLLNSYGKDHAKASASFGKAEEMAEGREGSENFLTPLFYFWYGAALERQKLFDEADAKFRKCIELDPAHAEAYNYIAYMWAEQGLKLDECLELSQKSLELEPENAAFIDTLGWIYFMKGDYEKALVEVRRAANLMPEDPTIVQHMGDVMEKLGKPDKALNYWKRSFVLDPEQEELGKRLTNLNVDLEPLRSEAKTFQEQRAKDAEKKDRQKERTNSTDRAVEPADEPDL